MGVFEQWQGASFRGISFLVPTESEDTGQKTVTHEYPNSDERFIEQLGKIPPTFKMEGIVHGEDAIQQRIRLKEALTTAGLGDLVHPIYGTVSVKALPFSIRSSQTKMGEFIFSLEFAVSKENVSPSPETPTEQSVTQIALETNVALNVALEANLVDADTGALLTTTADKVTEISGNVQDRINSATNLIAENTATFNRIADAIFDNAFRIAQGPQDIAESLNDLYQAAIEVTEIPSNLENQWQELADFALGDNGTTSDFGLVDTVPRLQDAVNSNLLDEHSRLVALAFLYEAIAYTIFATVEQLEEAQRLLDKKYKSYLEDAVSLTDNAGLVSIATDPTVRQTFSNLRNTAREAINTKAQNLFRVVAISPGRSSMSLTAYKYYGNLDNLDLIKDLNVSVNVASFNETSLQAVSK